MSISIISAKRNEMPASLLRDMYKLRYEVFNKRLHWDVEDFGELEIDQFDYRNPNYIIAKDHTEKVKGCWRLMPTTDKYMLEEVFEYLLGDYPLPKDEKIWELSRLAIIDGKPPGYTLSESTTYLIKAIVDFAVENNISDYLAVTSVGMERLMKSAGIPVERIGVQKPINIGRVKSVLCKFKINDILIRRSNELIGEYLPQEIAA